MSSILFIGIEEKDHNRIKTGTLQITIKISFLEVHSISKRRIKENKDSNNYSKVILTINHHPTHYNLYYTDIYNNIFYLLIQKNKVINKNIFTSN